MTRKEIIVKIRMDYEKARSQWERGVLEYATDLLDYIPDDTVPTTEMLLNGAENWNQYSYGGCALVYDGDICERLCPPSEQRKKDYGRLQPNRYETWFDVQARALKQAAHKVMRYAKIGVKL